MYINSFIKTDGVAFEFIRKNFPLCLRSALLSKKGVFLAMRGPPHLGL